MYFNINMKKKGFSLVELLVAMAVGLVIMAAVYGVMNTAQLSSASIGRKVLTQQDAQTVLYLMAMEIRMASYNPRFNSVVWSTVPAADSTSPCTQMGLATSVVARKGIQIADSNNILVAMNLNPETDNIIGPPAQNEYIKYAYDSGTSTITRNVSCGGNQTILGGAGSSTMVINSETVPVTPLFQYFDESGTNDITAAVVATPDVSIRLIRRIRINIVADIETQGSSFKVSRRTYTTDVLVKNHVVSP
jgi:prepilin-type N-terminal cleavage/methylation domain-containing protein